MPFHLDLGGSVVMLNHDTSLYPYHLDPRRLYDFTRPGASVVAHPTEPGVWGLRNATDRSWKATRPDGEVVTVNHGQTLPLQHGTRLDSTDSTVTSWKSRN